MSKKYMLKIVYSDIQSRANFEAAKEIIEEGIDGKVFILTGTVYRLECTKRDFIFQDFIKLWLTEIKEPLSFDEWFKNEAFTEGLDLSTDEHKSLEMWTEDSWNACLENQKLGVVVDEEADIEAFRLWHNRVVGTSPCLSDSEYAFRKSLWLCGIRHARGLS